jgi:hypothetical protein
VATLRFVVPLLAASALAAGVAAGGPVFYLTLKPGQCAIRATARAKTVAVVPCSNPKHNLEVYAIRHGGWKHGTPPSHGLLVARLQFLCLRAFADVANRQMPQGYGWRGFWPDPGAEQKRYGDEVVCALTHFPRQTPLGAGRHL